MFISKVFAILVRSLRSNVFLVFSTWIFLVPYSKWTQCCFTQHGISLVTFTHSFLSWLHTFAEKSPPPAHVVYLRPDVRYYVYLWKSSLHYTRICHHTNVKTEDLSRFCVCVWRVALTDVQSHGLLVLLYVGVTWGTNRNIIKLTSITV